MLVRVDLLRSNPRFRVLFVSRTVSLVGDALSLVALMLYVAEQSGQALAVALLLLVGDFAPSLFAPLAGAISDRFDLRRVMVVCELVQAILMVALALWLPALPILLVLVGLRALAGHVFVPASKAAMPLLVAAGDLERANAALGVGSNLGEVAGPLLAAGLLPLVGTRATLALDAGTFVVSAVVLTRLPSLTRTQVVVESMFAAARNGMAAVWSRPVVRVIVFGFVAVVACNGVDDVALVFLVRDTLGGSASALAIALAAVGVGILVGLLVITKLSGRLVATALFVAGLALTSAANLGTGLVATVAFVWLFQAVRGLGVAGMDIGSTTSLQRLVPTELMGRVFGNLYGLIGVGAAGSYVLGGLLVDATGPALTFVLAGCGGLLCTAVVGWRLAAHREPGPPADKIAD